MPELAEVETLKRYLENHIIGKKITTFEKRRENLRYVLSDNLVENSEGAKIIAARRRAKFLDIQLDNSKSLVFHLGMSGRLTYRLKDYLPQKHDHIIISFSGMDKLVFNDARRFGMVYSCPSDDFNNQKFMVNMGPEPLELEFDAQYLKGALAKKTAPIKTALMDSRIVVGVGNIYAAESLFTAGIHPERRASSLQQNEIEKLTSSIKNVLSRAIQAGGTTLRDFVSGDNNPGYFKQELNVYDRFKKPCMQCHFPIEKIVQAGRSTFFCGNCQG